MLRKTFLAAASLATLLAAAAPGWADGHVIEHGDLMIMDVWARESHQTAKAGASYLSIMNHGDTPDRLIGASAGVSNKVEIHTHIMENDVMKMRQVDGIDLPAGETTALAPGGDHIMFMGLNGPFEEGSEFPLTLVFEKAGEIEVTVAVKDIAHKGAGHSGHSNHSGHGDHN